MISRILMSTIVVLSPVALAAQDRPASQPQVEVWLNDNGSYEQGDRMRVFFRTDRDAYVTVVRVTTEGHVRVLFPETPIENNFVAGNAEYEIVQYGDQDYRIHDDPGHGYVFAVASLIPFDYTSFSAGAVWDYHLLSFEGEEERDPYDTFAHVMDDILAPDTDLFAYEAASYAVDERGSRFYRATYSYYAVPHYHDCYVYRAFWGLRSYYVYNYDCGLLGVDIVLGSHYYHDDYYHYGYRGYDTYYYGAGSVYRYRYVGGGYRHDHGARRVSRSVYSGLGRHSERNPSAGGGRTVVDRRSATSPTTRRTVPSGSPVRTATTPTPRRVGALTPQGTSDGRRVTVPSQTPAPTPRAGSGSLTRRQSGTSSAAVSPRGEGGSVSGTTGSATPRRVTPVPTSSGGTVSSPSTSRRTTSASPPPSNSQPSTVRRTPSTSTSSQPSTVRRTPSTSTSSQPSTVRRTPSTSSSPAAPRSAPRASPPPSRSTGSAPRPSAGSSAPRSSPSRSPSPSTSRRRPGN